MTTTTPKNILFNWRMFVTFGDGWRDVHIYNGRTSWARSWHPRHGWDTEDWRLTRGDPPQSSRDMPPGLHTLEDPRQINCAVSDSMLEEWNNTINQLQVENKKLRIGLLLFFIISLPFLIK